jgi:hypothetical protein
LWQTGGAGQCTSIDGISLSHCCKLVLLEIICCPLDLTGPCHYILRHKGECLHVRPSGASGQEKRRHLVLLGRGVILESLHDINLQGSPPSHLWRRISAFSICEESIVWLLHVRSPQAQFLCDNCLGWWGRDSHLALCPRLNGSCLDLADPTRGRFLAAYACS